MALRVQQEPQAQLVQLVLQVHRVNLGQMVPLEQSARLGRKANLDKMEPLVLRVISARLVHKVSKAPLARTEPLVSRGRRAIRVL